MSTSIISTKKYQCLACGNVENHPTNHFGEIYCNCNKCGNIGLQCMEPEAINARKYIPIITTYLHKYSFDISKPEQKAQYNKLKIELKLKGYKLFDCISGVSWDYFNLLPNEISIETSYVFIDQWNSSVGRVHDWYEVIYPNKNIKRGYWLELTAEHAKAREPKTYNCKTTYNGVLLGEDTVKAINTGTASNVVFNKYFTDDMDIWQYNTVIELSKD